MAYKLSAEDILEATRPRLGLAGRAVRGFRGSSLGALSEATPFGFGLSREELASRASEEPSFALDTAESLGALAGDIPAMGLGGAAGAAAGGLAGPLGAAIGSGSGAFSAPELVKALYEEWLKAQNELGDISFKDFLSEVAKRTGKAGAKGAIFGAAAKAMMPYADKLAERIAPTVGKVGALAAAKTGEMSIESGILSVLDTAFDDAQPLESFRDNLAVILGAKIGGSLARKVKSSLKTDPSKKKEVAQLLLEYKPEKEAEIEKKLDSMVLPMKEELSPESRPLLEAPKGEFKLAPMETPITPEQAAKAEQRTRVQKEGLVEEDKRASKEPPKSQMLEEKDVALKNRLKDRTEKARLEAEKELLENRRLKKEAEKEKAKRLKIDNDPKMRILLDKKADIEESLKSERARFKKNPTERNKQAVEKLKAELKTLDERIEKTSSNLHALYRHRGKTTLSNEGIVKEMAKRFGATIKEGRLHPKAEGVFKPFEKVLRLRSLGDYETAAHEIAHMIDEAFVSGKDLGKTKGYKEFEPYREELAKFADELGVSEGQDPISEGLAELMAQYMVNPDLAREVAPRATAKLESLFHEKAPQVLDSMQYVQKKVREKRNLSPLDQISSHIHYDHDKSRMDRLKESFSSLRADPKKFVRDAWESFYAKVFDAAAPVYKYSPETYTKLRLFAGVDGKVLSMLEGKGVPNFKDPTKIEARSLQEILKPIDNVEHFDSYLVALRTLDYEKKGMETGISPELSRAGIDQTERQHPQYKKVAEELQGYQDAVLRYYKDAGMLSSDLYNAIKKNNVFYVPLHRVFEGTVDMFSPKGTKQLVKKATGGIQSIKSPIQNIARNTAMLTRMAERNNVLYTLAKDLSTREGLGHIFELIGDDTATKSYLIEEAAKRSKLPESTFEQVPVEMLKAMVDASQVKVDGKDIKIFIDGKPQIYEVDPLLHQAFSMTSRQEVPLLVNMMAAPAQSLRAFTTHTPDFIVKSFLRDIPEAMIKTQYGITLGDIQKGLVSAIKKDALYWDWAASGGAYSSPKSLSRASMLEKVTTVEKKGIVGNYMEYAGAIENAIRLAEYSKGIEKEGNTKEGREKAALASRDVTIDFAKMGSAIPTMNRLVAFSAAHLNGIDSFIRAFKPRYVDGKLDMMPYYRAAAWVGLPSVVLGLLNSGEDWYEQQPAYIRDTFWLNKVGDKIIRVPKPFEMGLLGSAIEKMISYTRGHNPRAFHEMKEMFIGIAESRLVIPTAVIPIAEQWANKTIFTGRTIVPVHKQEGLRYLQYGSYQTETSKLVAKKLADIFGDSFSPAIAENYLRAWTGTAGNAILQTIDKALVKGGVIQAPAIPAWKDPSEWPLFRSFFARYPTNSSRDIEAFWSAHSKQVALESSIKSLLKEGKTKEAKELLAKAEKADMKPYYKAMRKILQSIQAIQNSERMGSDEKRDLIDQHYLQMMAIAQKAMSK